MPKTKRMTATRRTSTKTPRRQAAKMLQATAVALPFKVSPSVRRKMRRNLPVAAAIVVGGAAITTTLAMREQVASLARAIGDAGASGWKSVAGAIPVDRWLVRAGLRQRPFWARALLPALGVVGGLLASGAVLFFATRGEDAPPPSSGLADAEELYNHSSRSPSLANSGAEFDVPSPGHG
jgi:hypothetical protein